MKFWNHGILGLNARSLKYIRPFNRKKAMIFADNKLRTKAFLTARGIPSAKIFAKIENREQLRAFDFKQLPNECVLKPNFGYGGEGILILKGRNKNGHFLLQGKTPISNKELEEHIEDILEGKFALGGHLDTAFFEQILTPHSCFARFRPVGLPDIRVIVFNLIPVMAMLRIPTASSEGKANLHLGGLGIGIDIAKGVTTHAAQYHSIITELPHGGSPSGIEIPYWDDILQICANIQHITNIGYLAVDITIDEQLGPALLEVNARAGLNVQIANLSPLQSRLERVQGLSVGSPEKGVEICKNLFGGKNASTSTATKSGGKPVLGTREIITIAGTGTSYETSAIISPDQERTTFSTSLIEKIRKTSLMEQETENGSAYRVKFTLGDEKIQTLIYEEELPTDGVDVVIGKRDLAGFLIDPSKEVHQTVRSSSVKTDLRAFDSILAELDRELLLIKALKPINLDEERAYAEEDPKYNPTFLYPEITTDLEEAKKKLENGLDQSSPLGKLLEKKRKELLKRIDLLESRGDAEKFTAISSSLFGTPNAKLLKSAQAILKKRIACDLPLPSKELRSAEQAKERFEEVLKHYSLHNWQVSIRSKLVADCTVGGTKVYIREGAEFSDEHIASLIAHEIETHVLTAENGDHQPYSILRRGCANYLDTQEGLAVYNQNGVLGPHTGKRYHPPKSIINLAFALDHSFAETREFLEHEQGYTPEKALSIATLMKRGLSDTSEKGGFTKSLVYFRGLRAIEKFVKDGGDLKRLYIGKVAIEDLETIEALEDLHPPLLIPEFLR